MIIAMLAPNTVPLMAYGAEWLGNRPRYVDFTRPKALSLEELGLEYATGSNTVIAPEKTDPKDTPTATPSELREPELFYDDSVNEPDGILVQFDEERNIRTYQQGEGEYVTVVGGYSGLYRDSDGVIRTIDNRMVSTGKRYVQAEDEEEEIQDEVELINDLGTEMGYPDEIATSSNASRVRNRRVATASNAYYNREGKLEVYLPENMNRNNGYSITRGNDTIEIIPQEGDYSQSMADENAVRYSNVFDGIDIQYTVIGDRVKEDIILLERQERNAFSYQLRSDTLKFKKDGDAVLAYRDSYHRPVFALTAPVMIDADGNTSTKIKLAYNSSSGTVTYTADKDWLDDPDRAYPVRIDPTGALLVDYSAFQMNMVAKGGKHLGTPNAYQKYFGPNVNPMAGFSEDYGYCRALIHIDAAWEALMGRSDGTEGPGLDRVQLKLSFMTKDAPNKTAFQIFIPNNSWNPANVTWERMKDGNVDAGMKPSGEVQYSTGIPGDSMTFDITEVYYNWLENPESRHGLLLQAAVEGGDGDYIPGITEKDTVSWAETFYNQNGGADFGLCLEVAWRGELENVDLLTMDMSKFSVRVDPGVVESDAGGRNTRGVLAHGASQAYSTVDYRLKTEDGSVVLEGSTEAHDEVDCPDYLEIDDDCLRAVYQDSNWQSDPALTLDPLQMDTIYFMEAKGTGKEVVEDEEGNPMLGDNEVSTEWKQTDEFLLYLVQASDILPRIARHYGIQTNTLMKDNQLGFQLAQAGDAVFIREPQTDASFDDLNGAFAVTRTYNGLTPYFRSEFGMGWNSLIGERIMVLQDGSILYTREDGKGMVFTKTGKGTFKAPDGYDYELKAVDTIELATGSGKQDEGDRDTNGEPDDTGAVMARGFLPDGDGKAESGEEFRGDADGEESGVEPVEPSTGWEITEPDGTVRTFNSYGLLVTEKNRKGHKTSYVYDDGYLLTEIIAPSGKSYEVTMEPDGKITEIMLPDGGILTYEYDGEDNLVAVTNAEGDTRRYEYDENHRMTAWYDENGTRVIENIMDEKGRVVEQTDALGNVMYFAYTDGQTVMTDNNGSRTVYTIDDLNRNVGIRYGNGDQEYTTYSADNRIESRTDANGAITRYTYDKNGNVLTETRDDKSKASFTYNELNLPETVTDYEGNVTRFHYDEKGNLLSVTDGEGNTTRYAYDELSRITAVTDANGGTGRFTYEGTDAPVVSYTDPEGGTSTFTYDEMNRVLTQTDPEGNTTEHQYNANGWETAVTAPDGGVTVYEFSPAGEVLSITDALGVATIFTYDAMHNILSGEDALGNTLTYTYDGNYNKISETNAKGDMTGYTYDDRNRITDTTDALGNSVSYVLDGRGSIISATDRRGNTTEFWQHKVLGLPTMVKDALGNETYYTYDKNGSLTRIAYPDGTSVSYAYDRAGRMVRMTAQNGLETEIGYDGNGNMIRITDDDTRIYRFAYDGNNRLVKATDPLGGVTVYAYDGAGNRTRVTDANGNSTGYGYDAVGRLEEIQDALGGTVSSTYDLMGRTLDATDQNGNAVQFHYDAIGQVLAQVDAAGNITAMEYDPLGNVTKVTDALKGETAYDVDALSRTVKMTDALGGEYEYLYDANGNLLRIAMPDGDTVNMSYDANNRMTHYRDEASVITRYEYDAMGRIIRATDTAGNTMDYEYDGRGSLVRQTDTIGRDAIYEYDKFGRLVSVTGTDLATTTYTYDALDRLTSVTQADGTVTAYEYDAVGNLIKTTEPGEAVYTYAVVRQIK